MSENRGSVRRGSLLLAVCLLLVGCATPKFWTYSARANPVAPQPLSEKSLAVTAFVDARPTANSDYLLLHLVPFLPFGWQNFETPEKMYEHVHSTIWEFHPTEDLARAMASELARSQLFRLVNYTQRTEDYDLVLEGRILSTKFIGFRLSHGLSIAAPVLWLAGLPSAHVTNRLELLFLLKETKTGRTLWSSEYLSEVKGLNGLYYERPDFYYPELFCDIAQTAIHNLETLMRAAGAGAPTPAQQ